mmetsp:Transcript_28386/g.66628  ORF Transcript_28386/g.66628 Transcript_28386/m.66628 type:complete len:232 (+) Transcript_28386:1274-1969(+)
MVLFFSRCSSSFLRFFSSAFLFFASSTSSTFFLARMVSFRADSMLVASKAASVVVVVAEGLLLAAGATTTARMAYVSAGARGTARVSQIRSAAAAVVETSGSTSRFSVWAVAANKSTNELEEEDPSFHGVETQPHAKRTMEVLTGDQERIWIAELLLPLLLPENDDSRLVPVGSPIIWERAPNTTDSMSVRMDTERNPPHDTSTIARHVADAETSSTRSAMVPQSSSYSPV